MDIVNKSLVVLQFYCVIYGYLARSLKETLLQIRNVSNHLHLLQTESVDLQGDIATKPTATNSITNITYTLEEILATCAIKNVTIRTACVAALVGKTNSDSSDEEAEVKPTASSDSVSTISVGSLSYNTTLSSSKEYMIGSYDKPLGMPIKTNTSIIIENKDKAFVVGTLKTTLADSYVSINGTNRELQGVSTLQAGLSLVIPENIDENISMNVNSVKEITPQTTLFRQMLLSLKRLGTVSVQRY